MEIGLALTGETAVSGGVVVTVGEPAFFVFIFPRGLDFARAIFVCVCVCVLCSFEMDGKTRLNFEPIAWSCVGRRLSTGRDTQTNQWCSRFVISPLFCPIFTNAFQVPLYHFFCF